MRQAVQGLSEQVWPEWKVVKGSREEVSPSRNQGSVGHNRATKIILHCGLLLTFLSTSCVMGKGGKEPVHIPFHSQDTASASQAWRSGRGDKDWQLWWGAISSGPNVAGPKYPVADRLWLGGEIFLCGWLG